MPPQRGGGAEPAFGAPAIHQQVGRNAEQRIGGKEYPRAQRKGGLRQRDIDGHRVFGKADVDPVDKRDEVHGEHQWHQSAPGFADGGVERWSGIGDVIHWR